MINENNKESIGKYSLYASSIFRFLAILLILTPFTMATAGIGGIVAIIFYKLILKLVPFRISLYQDYKEYEESKIDLANLYKQWKKKYYYTFYLLAFIIISISLILINDDNDKDRIFFTILLIILLLISIPQILFLSYIKKNIIRDFKPTVQNNNSKERKSFSLLKFYFDDDIKLENLNLKNKFNSLSYPLNEKAKKLKKEEIIILSIIVGIVIGLIFGYFFGETEYYNYQGKRIMKYKFAKYSNFNFNYLIGVSSLFISSGFCYIFLNRKKEDNNN